MEATYTIGEISKCLGISKDALRFYEKRGIIQPNKHGNGYRYYTYEDIQTIIDIMFYRKFDFTIEEIHQLLHNSSYDSITETIHHKIQLEVEQLTKHRQSLIQLQAMEQRLKRAKEHINTIRLLPMPKHDLVNEIPPANPLGLLNHVSFYEQYHVYDDYTTPQGKYLLFSHDLENQRESLPSKKQPSFPYGTCAYTVICSPYRSPKKNEIEALLQWCKQHTYQPTGSLYAGSLMHCKPKEESVFFIELYLPIKK